MCSIGAPGVVGSRSRSWDERVDAGRVPTAARMRDVVVKTTMVAFSISMGLVRNEFHQLSSIWCSGGESSVRNSRAECSGQTALYCIVGETTRLLRTVLRT